MLSYTFAECDSAGATTAECWGGTSADILASTAVGFINAAVLLLVSAATCSFNRLMEKSFGFVMTLSGVDVDTGTAVVVPLATARRVAESGVNLNDGRGGVDFDFLLAGCTATSCQPVNTN